VLGLLAGNWKILAAAGAVALIFLAGWKTNGWRYEAQYRAAEKQIFEEIAERRDELLEEFETTRAADQDARLALNVDLADLRAVNQALGAEIDAASLAKTEPEIVIQWRERVVREESDEICGPPVLANPFGPEFVRLFNQSADRSSGSVPGADPPG
jgi:hypothetical protein